MKYLFSGFFLAAIFLSCLRLAGVIDTTWRALGYIILAPFLLVFILFVLGVIVHHRRREKRQKRHQH